MDPLRHPLLPVVHLQRPPLENVGHELGLISVVMADPPWDIHMELPYGTLADEEVKNLNIGDIHEHG